MTYLDPNFVRWVRASCEKYFDANHGDYPIYFEEDPNRKVERQSAFYEFRLDGPDITQLSHNVFFVYVEINILITTAITKYVHAIDDMLGLMVSAANSSIPIYRLGDPTNASNTGELIACLDLMQGGNDKLEVNRFGRIHQDIPLRQATVEAHYSAQISF